MANNFYERLGVRLWKRWQPINGDLVRYRFWPGHGRLIYGDEQSVRSFIRLTYFNEAVHWIGFLTISFAAVWGALNGELTPYRAVVATVVNTLVNVYPILCQRYNRPRLRRVLAKFEARRQYGLGKRN